MSSRPLRIGVLGGVPPSIGGSGLEAQMQMTMAGLKRRGHEVFHVGRSGRPRGFDLLHAFGADVGIFHTLSHWQRQQAPLVVSPVLVVAPGRQERILRVTSRIRWSGTEARMRRAVLERADLLIALTDYERALLGRIAPRQRCVVIGNGVEPLELDPTRAPVLKTQSVVLLGAVSRRKRQLETVRSLKGTGWSPVVIGGIDSSVPADDFRAALEDSGGTWFGHVDDPVVVRGLLAQASALVHMSSAEGQSLAVLEAISLGVPVVAGTHPSNQELARRFPNSIRLCDNPPEVVTALHQLRSVRLEPAAVPSWDDVAEQIERVYRTLPSKGA